MKLSLRASLFSLFLLVFLGLANTRPGAVLAAPPAQADETTVAPANVDQPTAALDTPTVVVDEPVTEFALHAGNLYWIHNCPIIPLQAASAAQDVSTLRRQPAAGGAATTLLSDAQCSQLRYLVVDDADILYYNSRLTRIERIPLNNPNTTPISVTTAFNVDNMVADADFVYFTDSGNKIFRAPRAGGEAVTLYDTNFLIGDLVVDSEKIYWFDNGGLWWADKTCDTLPCTEKQNFLSNNGRNMQIGPPVLFGDPPTIYAIQGLSINGLRCRASDGLCPFDNYYTAAAGTSIGDYRFVFLPNPGPFPILNPTLFWTEVNSAGNTGRLLRRVAGSNATPDELYPTDANLLPQIATDSTGIYFSDSRQLLKLPFNAAAITRDLAADSLEVTQAIQNLANQAPLIADKPAYVRLYGKSNSGPRAGGVEAQLVGRRNGQPLPGSPLQPLNGGHALSSGVSFDRANLRDSWLFKLPASWTSAGAITLEGVVDPRTRYADEVAGNNVLAANVNFADEPNSCLFFSPVRTHNPLPKVGDPNFWETMARFTRLWPKASTDVRWMGEPIEELEFCSKWGIPYPCWGPYELDQGSSLTNFPSDKDRVIIKLIVRQAEARVLSLPPISMCEFGGSVHSVGLVHPQADTTAGNYTTNGYANLFFNASWYKMEPFTSVPVFPRWNWPPASNVLAQEVTHNFWRNHIDCGHPEGIDNGWPYNKPCQLNDGGQTNYYGFDPASQIVIPPEIASDFMSYEPSRAEAPSWQGHWVSDYTYKAVKDDALVQAASPASPQAPDLAAAAEMVYISGAADPDRELGYLEYAYTQTIAILSTGALHVWQSYAAPDLLAAQAVGAPLAATQPFTFHLRLKDAAGTVLADYALNLLEPDQHGVDPAAAPFLVSFPAPDGIVTRVELLDGEQVLDSLDIGPNRPTVQILAPSAGVTISDSLTIRWVGVDPDPNDVLHYSIYYSRDDGISWLPLANDYPGTPGEGFEELTLSVPEALPGSAGPNARVRVMASDGFHTASAEAGPFTVTERAPQPAIVLPNPTLSVPAGEVAVLSGAAYDAEDGSLTADALSWQVAGAAAGTGEEVVVLGLRPGAHLVLLTATDSDAQQGVAQSTLVIDPLALTPATGAPALDGGCDDGAYAAGKTLTLAPYEDGAQASVTLLWQQDIDMLWACFSGLARGSNGLVGQAALYADVDHSGGGVAQSDDIGFLVGEDGGVVTTLGDGSGGYAGVGPGGLAARVSASGSLWQAELQIALTSLGGPGHVLGLALGHFNVATAGDAFAWPYAAQSAQPNTWAETVLGEWPYLRQIEPISTTVSAPVILTLTGDHFAPTATVLLDGAPLLTTVVSPTQLTANLGATFVGSAALAKLTVTNAGLTEAPSNALIFTIQNKAPTITAISPQNAAEDGAGFKLTVQGNNFAAGAIVRWNGQPLPTTAAGNALEATVDAGRLAIAGPVLVVVENPEPGGGLSNGVAFTINPTFRQLLPLVAC